MNLLISYFHSENEYRNLEFKEALLKNINNNLITTIYIFAEKDFNCNEYDCRKIQIINVTKKPFYSDFFQYIKDNNLERDINIISNSDIYFDDTLKRTVELHVNQCYALSRYEDGVIIPNTHNSQDAWIVRNIKNELVNNSQFSMGTPGCDNHLAAVFKNAGYKIDNPSHSIVIHHLHKSKYRTYTDDDIIWKEWVYLPACTIEKIKI